MIARVPALILVAVLATPFNGASLGGAPPPVSRPQGCAAAYCVEVIPQDPYLPYQIETSTNLENHSSRLLVKLKHGGAVAFKSRIIERRQIKFRSFIPAWNYEGNLGTVSICLTCSDPTRKHDRVLGIAITGIPFVREKNLADVMDVCYWPLSMTSVGHGMGDSMTLGEK